jgi:hypothetical protein
MRPYDGLAGRRPAVLASAAVNPTAQARSSSSHALKFLPDEVIGWPCVASDRDAAHDLLAAGAPFGARRMAPVRRG